MTRKYTPGPWVVDGYDGEGFEIWSNEPEYLGQIATAFHNIEGEDVEIAKANAGLIAISPELLEKAIAVIEMWDVFSYGDYCADDTGAIEALREVINKL